MKNNIFYIVKIYTICVNWLGCTNEEYAVDYVRNVCNMCLPTYVRTYGTVYTCTYDVLASVGVRSLFIQFCQFYYVSRIRKRYFILIFPSILSFILFYINAHALPDYHPENERGLPSSSEGFNSPTHKVRSGLPLLGPRKVPAESRD